MAAQLAQLPDHVAKLGPAGYSEVEKRVAVRMHSSGIPAESVSQTLHSGSKSSVERWTRQHLAGQSLRNQSPGPTPGSVFKMDPEDLQLLDSLMQQHPDFMLAEVVEVMENAGCTDLSVCDIKRGLTFMGFTHKARARRWCARVLGARQRPLTPSIPAGSGAACARRIGQALCRSGLPTSCPACARLGAGNRAARPSPR